MNNGERHRVISEAVREAVDSKTAEEIEQKEQQRGDATRSPHFIAWIVITVSVSVSVWIWTARPGFLFNSSRARPMTNIETEASMRFAIFLERGRIAAFLDEHGKPPANLEAAGDVEAGVDYELRRDGSYLLTASANSKSLFLTDAMDADSFLGSSLEILRNRK